MNHAADNGLRLIDFDTGALFGMLAARDAPASEFELLREVTGGQKFPSGRERLFELHFSFFHALYRLKAEAGAKGYYLHLEPSRIRLVRVPGNGSCRRYDPDTGRYCSGAARGDGFCASHDGAGLFNAPSFDPLLEFYTNPDNISFGASPILEKLMKGAVVYALRRGEIERALGVFGLSRPTRKRIKARYHELARSFHPDLNPGHEAQMKELNHSYRVLMEIFII